MNELKIFNNPEFGKIRVVEINDNPYAVGNDVAKALEYAVPKDAISAHCKGAVSYRLPTKGGNQEMKVIPTGDILRLVVKASEQSKNINIREKAERYERWIFDEVLPAIHKTGTYSIKKDSTSKEDIQLKRAKAMELNAKNRRAKLLLAISDDPICTKEYKQVIYSKVTKMLTGEELIPLPSAGPKTYSATDIGKQFNISKTMVGKIANEHHLKIPEYGKLFYDKSPHCDKQVETWRYYESVIPVFAQILGVEVIGL